MSYTINHYNGTLLTTVADGTVDTSTDITLIGKNYAGYGQAQNDNFVWLLENFANTTQPSHPLAGQIWFDSANLKLKFYDGSRFRTAGGTEVSATPPVGLTVGDLWFDTDSDQLFAYNGNVSGNPFTLIGPQGLAGAGLTEMQSIAVKDISGNTHYIIEAIIDGVVVFIISKDAAFTLDPTINSITGFDKIEQGLTLAYTQNADQGITNNSVAYRWWGTATNSDKLNGLPGSSYLTTLNPVFSSVVSFSDLGYTMGGTGSVPSAKLKVSITNNGLTPTFQNIVNDTILFQTTNSGSNATYYPLTIKGTDLLPGGSSVVNNFTSTNSNNIGSSSAVWANVYATNFVGTATNANYLSLGGTPVSATTASAANTIVGRDSNQDIFANVIHGTATTANYADLAEKYLPDQAYETGTVVSVGGAAEVTAAMTGDLPLGVISENPAFRMNQTLVGGVYVALKGRVPVKVIGPITKGQRLIAADSGHAQAATDKTDTFAIALETDLTESTKLVECVIL
jgi:hypothetical protein